jgi:hypothetical protein
MSGRCFAAWPVVRFTRRRQLFKFNLSRHRVFTSNGDLQLLGANHVTITLSEAQLYLDILEVIKTLR